MTCLTKGGFGILKFGSGDFGTPVAALTYPVVLTCTLNKAIAQSDTMLSGVTLACPILKTFCQDCRLVP